MSAESGRSGLLAPLLYLALALVGLVLTWYCNLTYTGLNYLGDWFANRASASAAFDILIVFVVCCVFYVREARRLGWRLWIPVVFAALSLAVAVAFALPLFLAARELRLASSSARGMGPHQHEGVGSLVRLIRRGTSTTGMDA